MEDKGESLRSRNKGITNNISRKDFLKGGAGAAGLLALSGSGLFSLFVRESTVPGNVKKKVKELIGKMKLEEKISQLRYDAPAIDRLNIPKYNWWNECLHGVARAGLATVFPQAIGLAASWNGPLLQEAATAISDEARAKHAAFVKRGLRQIYMGLTFWSPNINLVRDPRWGRGQETYGEDPHLTGQMAVHFIKGLQGDDEDNLKVVSTAKHFAVYNGPEPKRHNINVEVSPQDLHETYLPQFEMAIKEGQARSVMCAYNSVDGMPCCSNNPLLHEILRNQWNFDGYIVSDCWAISDIWKGNAHNVAKDTPAAAAMALKSGTDLNCGVSYRELDKAVDRGLIKEEQIDQSLQRLFEVRYHLGMYDGKETGPYTDIPYSVVSSSEHKQKSLEIARESIVLLKNDHYAHSEKPLLPFSDDIKKLAVIGPNADDDWVMLGNYYGTPDEIVTPLKGIKKKAFGRDIDVLYAQGCDIAEGWDSLEIIPSENLVPSKGSGSGLYGAYFGNEDFKGSPPKSRVDKVINFRWKDNTPVTGKMAEPFSVRWTGKLKAPKTGTYVISFKAKNAFRLYFEGKLKAKSESEHDPIERRIRLNLKEGQEYPIKIEYVNRGPDPQAHLSWSVPDRHLEAEAIDVAKQADAVVLCMGLNSSLEGEEMPIEIEGFNGGDKTNLQLPDTQLNLMKNLHSMGKPTVLVLMTGSAVTFPWAEEHIPAILEAWYGGQEGGSAIADVLFGDYNPGARLPVTFYERIDDVPAFTDYSMDGRTYKYFKGTPFYPFGYGLSYTTFAYSNFQLPDKIAADQPLEARVTVKNTGNRAGDEVVQLYISHPDADIRKPRRSLQGFQRIHLEEGESKTVRFLLDPKQLTLIDETGTRILPEGHLKISVGGKQPGFSGRADAQTTEVLERIIAIR